jgi:hypothetical protein
MNTSEIAPAASFRKYLGTGLLVWLLAGLALVAVGRWFGGQASWFGAAGWAVERAWIAFLVGLAAVVVLAGRDRGGLVAALAAYAVPLGVAGALGAACYGLFPDEWFLSELLGYLPLVWVFGVLGWLWVRLRPGLGRGESLVRALLPPLVGGVAVLCGVVVPVFRSNQFRYRDAFRLSLQKAVPVEGGLVADALLEVRKPGDYQFRAVRFSNLEFAAAMESESDLSIGAIEWSGGKSPAAGATGSYPLTIRWAKSPAIVPPAEVGLMEDSVILEVRTNAEPETVVHTITAPLPAR